MSFETEEHNVAGYGSNGKPFFWIGQDAKPNLKEFVGKTRGLHSVSGKFGRRYKCMV
jgi:hypothetical protein